MTTQSLPDVLTIEQARAIKAQAIALGRLGALNRRVLTPLLDGVLPQYDANHMTMWAVLNEEMAVAA